MNENMKRYLEQVAADEALRGALLEMEKLPPGEQRQALMDHAAKLGLPLREEDLGGCGELSDDELENVSGGSVSLITVLLSTLAIGGVVLWPGKAT